MKLRPRYSLLTLLILTALVAVGVKLWFGPHHVVMSDPPTREEQVILDHHPLLVDFFRHRPPTFEYGYTVSWNGKHVLYLLGRVDLRQTFAFLESDRGKPIRMLDGYAASREYLESKATPPEHILVLIDVNPAPTPGPNQKAGGAAPRDWMGELQNLYFLSSHRRIYRMAGGAHVQLPVQEVALDTIPDVRLRAHIATELAKIPEELQRPYTINPALALKEAAVFTAVCTESHAKFVIQARKINGNE